MNRFQQLCDKTPFKPHHIRKSAASKPRRAIAWLLLVVFFVSILPLGPGGWGMMEAHAEPLEPFINRIIIQKTDNLVDMDGIQQKETTFRIVFEGFRVNQIDTIFFLSNEGEDEGAVLATRDTEEFTMLSTTRMAAENITSFADFFGGSNKDMKLQLVDIDDRVIDQDYVFGIPSSSLPDIEEIFDGDDWRDFSNWPATVRKTDEQELWFRGSNLASIDDEEDRLQFIRGGETIDNIPFTVNTGVSPTRIEVDMEDDIIPSGRNMGIRIERQRIKNVEVHYQINNGINIIQPLDLGEVDITPLEGSRGTVLRIRAGMGDDDPDDLYRNLVRDGVRVFVGGEEAPRNIVEEGDEGLTGKFKYDIVYDANNNIVEYKEGLEVVVPFLETGGNKQIQITNPQGDVYVHDEFFNYFEVEIPRLTVTNLDPTEGLVRTRNTIRLVTINELLSIDNLSGIDSEDMVLSAEMGTVDNLVNHEFRQEAETLGDDGKVLFYRYVMEDGTQIEKRITITIGLLLENLSFIGGVPAENNFTAGSIPRSTDLAGRTQAVGSPATVPVRIRTETAVMDSDDELLNYVVEQAPVGEDDRTEFTFLPEDDGPQIENIQPSQGLYDEHIIATITGSNFLVRSIDGEQYMPTVVIGRDGRYKVINQDGMFTSDSSSGSYEEEDRIEPEEGDAFQAFQVLTEDGRNVDGQVRSTGTQIKLTIPADREGSYMTGAVDVYVRNPGPDGGSGGLQTVLLNGFEYMERPAPGTEIIIDSVAPDRVAVGSMERVVVEGRRFNSDVEVYVDGELVPDAEIDVPNNRITFNAPVGRPGETWLQLLNPRNGSIASHPFEFVQTDSEPVITEVVPNIGGKGALVIIRGNNFFSPDPDGSTEAERKGTLVYLEGKDVNQEYALYDPDDDEHGGMRPFTDPYSPEQIEIPDPSGNPIKTYGSHVAVVDSQTIYMIIPDPNPGGAATSFTMNTPLDIEVINPDLGKDMIPEHFTILDIPEGQRPIIDDIQPQLGDFRGGNIVEISGSQFSDEARVFFGTQEATVFRRSNTGTWIRVFVPPYPGNLGDQNSAFVPVTVQNRNNSSRTVYNGYEYVNPGYTVTIERVVEPGGNTAGGDRVLIHGDNFRALRLDNGDNPAEYRYPEVYFGGVRVDQDLITFPTTGDGDVEFSEVLVVEETPSNPAGPVDVTVINYDGATGTLTNGFEYLLRQVQIDRILPNQGSIYGGDEITIIGSDFVERGLHAAFGDESGETDLLSGFGNISLGNIHVRYDNGEITFYYRQINDGFEMDVYKEESEDAEHTYTVEDENTYFFTIPWSELAEDEDDEVSRWADEGLKVTIEDGNMTFARRLGEILNVEGENRIRLRTPPGASVGRVDLTVYNSDGENDSGDFFYTSPFRPPVITEVIPVIQNYEPNQDGIPDVIDLATSIPQGGSPLIIRGANFRAGVSVYIGDVEATIVNRSLNDDELIVTVPPHGPNPVGAYLRILVTNDDGGMAYGDLVPEDQTRNPYYFRYTPEGSEPVIDEVTPNEGPVTGGTRITITGRDFRGEDAAGNPRDVQVFMGGIPVDQDDVSFINFNTLEVVVPAGRVGSQTVEVLNHDFGRAINPDMFTYISQPRITSMEPSRIFANDQETDIQVTGEMFQNGATVILGGRLVRRGQEGANEEVTGEGIRGVDEEGRNQEYSVIGGVEASNVNVIDEENMTLRFPEALDLPNDDIIIINPDRGISLPHEDFDYDIPIPDAPLVLEAIPGSEGSVHLIWSESDPELLNAASSFEIYGKARDDSNYTFIANTEEADFLVRNLQPNTRYDFRVRALNEYGSAIESAEASVRTLRPQDDPKLEEKLDELDRQREERETQGREEILNGTVVRTVGSREIPASATPYIIDFSGADYSRYNEFVVAFPVQALSGMNRPVTITDGTGSLTITPNNLYTRQVSSLSTADSQDGVARVHFTRMQGTDANTLSSAVARTQQRASAPYSIDFSLKAGRTEESLPRILGSAQMNIGLDSGRYPGSTTGNTAIGTYDPSSHSFRRNNGATATLREPGMYMLLRNR